MSMHKRTSAHLLEAAQKGNIEELSSLLGNGVSLNVRDDKGWSPLHWATQQGKREAVELLINAGATVDTFDAEGFSPLMLAVGDGRLGLVRLLIAHGANPNQKCKAHKNGTPLHLACAWNRLRVSRELVNSGADVNAVDLAGRSPLFFAVMYGHKQIIKLLIDHGAVVDLDKKDTEENKTILDLAIETNDLSIIDLLKSPHPFHKRK